MSLQAQPQQQPQQPVQVYPNPVTNEPASGHSNGSFGTVFIVLAVIVVISAIACFLGRLCNKRYHSSHSHGRSQKPVKQQKQVHNVRFKDFEDIEVGFDKRMPAAKPHGQEHGHEQGHGHGHGQGNGNGYGYGGGRGPRPPPTNGDMRKGFEMRVGGDGKLRATT